MKTYLSLTINQRINLKYWFQNCINGQTYKDAINECIYNADLWYALSPFPCKVLDSLENKNCTLINY